MSQTLAQRKALAARAARQPDPQVRPDLGRFDPISFHAMQTVQALLRSGATLVHVERGRVLLRRQDSLCVVDSAGRVTWSAGR